jgi:hypothetical protein
MKIVKDLKWKYGRIKIVKDLKWKYDL